MLKNIPPLTTGALPRIFRGETLENAVLQILAVKAITNENGRRYRFLVSDGQNSCQLCIMIGQDDIEEKISKGELEKFSVIKLRKYSINAASPDKKVLIMLEPECLVKGSDVGLKIGNPANYDPKVDPITYNPTSVGGVSSSVNSFAGRNSSFQEASRRDSFGLTDQEIREDLIIPISQVTPYNNKWAIRGRCTSKTGKKFWNNAKGDGTLFSFALQDDSGEIRITAFKSECEKYFELIELDKVYTVSKAIVKNSNKRYAGENHDYEITLSRESIINIGDESDASCPQLKYHTIKIKDLEATNSEAIIDIIAIVKDPGQLQTIMSKQQKELKKRDLTLVDDSGADVKITLWNDLAESFAGVEGSVFAAKKVKVSDYGGKSLGTLSSTRVELDPRISEAHRLRGWWDKGGQAMNFSSLTLKPGGSNDAEAKTLKALSKEAVMNAPNQSVVILARAAITQTGKLQLYYGCPSCKKKLVDMQNGTYKCDKCREEKTNPDCKIILSFCVSDCTGSTWVTAFQEEAEILLGKKSDEIHSLKQMDEDISVELMSSLHFNQSLFKIRAKLDNYKEETRIRAQILGLTPLNPVDYSNHLLKSIASLTLS